MTDSIFKIADLRPDVHVVAIEVVLACGFSIDELRDVIKRGLLEPYETIFGHLVFDLHQLERVIRAIPITHALQKLPRFEVPSSGTSGERPTMGIKEAAKHLKVSDHTLRALVRQGKIAASVTNFSSLRPRLHIDVEQAKRILSDRQLGSSSCGETLDRELERHR